MRSEFDTRDRRYGKSKLLEKLYKSHTTTVYNTCFVVHTFENMTKRLLSFGGLLGSIICTDITEGKQPGIYFRNDMVVFIGD